MTRAINVLNSKFTPEFRLESNVDFLPPIYKLFLRYYDLEPIFKEEVVYKEDKDYKYRIAWELDKANNSYLNNEDGDTDITFLSQEMLVEENTIDSKWKDNGLALICATESTQVYVGIIASNLDTIYTDRDWGNNFTLIASDIFDFFSRLQLRKSEMFLQSIGLEGSMLYQNWNENFWRINKILSLLMAYSIASFSFYV